MNCGGRDLRRRTDANGEVIYFCVNPLCEHAKGVGYRVGEKTYPACHNEEEREEETYRENNERNA